MKKLFFLFLLQCFFINTIVTAQTPTCQWGAALTTSINVWVASVAADDRGYAYLSVDGALFKYDTLGQQMFGITNNLSGAGVAIDQNRNIWTVGGARLKKFSNSGASMLDITTTGKQLYAVYADKKGNIFITGSMQGSGSEDIFIAKYDTAGSLQFVKLLSGSYHDAGKSITTDTAGNIYVCGYVNNGAQTTLTYTIDFNPDFVGTANSQTGSNDGFLLKLDPQGNYLWHIVRGASEYGQSSYVSTCTSVDVDNFGYVYLAFTHRVEKLTSAGVRVAITGVPGTVPGISYAHKLKVDRNTGNVFLATQIRDNSGYISFGNNVQTYDAGVYGRACLLKLDNNLLAKWCSVVKGVNSNYDSYGIDFNNGKVTWAGQFGDYPNVVNICGNKQAQSDATPFVERFQDCSSPSSPSSITGPTQVVTGTTVTYTATGGSSYAWNYPANWIKVDSLTSGDHIVLVVGSGTSAAISVASSNNCGNSAPVFLAVQAAACAASASTITTSACASYTSPSGNYTYTSSGTYMDTIPNAAGCDSVITINLTIGGGSSVAPLKQWDKRFGGNNSDGLRNITPIADGGYLLVGWSTSDATGDKTQACWGSTDFWLVKTDSNGTKVLDKRYGGTSTDNAVSAFQTADKGYFLGGYSESPVSGDKTQPIIGGQDYWVVRTDSNGVKLWDIRYGGTGQEWMAAMKKTSDGGYILAGSSISDISGDKTQNNWDVTLSSRDYWILKIDSTGIKQWDKRFGGIGDDELLDFQLTSDGGYILAGVSQSGVSGDKTEANRGGRDYWVVKTDGNGIKQWDKTFGGGQDDFLTSVKQTFDGGYMLGGFARSGISGDKTQSNWDATLTTSDYWLVKTNSTGIKQWDKRYGGSSYESFECIQQTIDGGFVLSGKSASDISGDKTQLGRGSNDYWLVKVNNSGVLQWDARFGGTGSDDGATVLQTASGAYVLAGSSYSGSSGDKTQSSQGDIDFWIVKTYPEISSITTGTINASICQGESYFFNGANRTTAGAYLDTLVNAAGCDSILTLNLTVNNNPVAGISPATVTFCNGGSATLTASGGGTYAWSNSLGNNAAVNVSPTITTTYSVTVTGANTCSATASKLVTVNQLPTPGISPATVTFCNGGSATLTASGGTTYAWSSSLGSNAAVNVSPTSTTTYTVTVTDANTCSATAQKLVTVNQLPNATINGPTAICSGLSATLTASGGNGYSWANGLGTNAQITVTPTNTTTYTVTVTDGNNCSATATQSVSVTSTPTASITGPMQICNGESATLTANGGNTYQWANGLGTNATITPSPTGTTTYTVTATIGANCSATATHTVTVYQPAASQFSQTICAGQSYTYNGIALTTAGAYLDTLQTVNGCDSIVTLTLTVSPVLTGSFTQAICGGTSYLFNGQQLTQAGAYADTLQTGGGCDSIVTLNLTINTLPQPTITKTLDTLSTQTYISYLWLRNEAPVNGGTSQTLTLTQTGNYSVVVTDANGCSDTSTVLNVTSVDLQNIVEEFGVKLYPNPNTGSFVIEFSDYVTREVEITDAIGKVILSSVKVEKQKQIALNETAAGVYFLNIKQNGQLKSLKFSLIR